MAKVTKPKEDKSAAAGKAQVTKNKKKGDKRKQLKTTADRSVKKKLLKSLKEGTIGAEEEKNSPVEENLKPKIPIEDFKRDIDEGNDSELKSIVLKKKNLGGSEVSGDHETATATETDSIDAIVGQDRFKLESKKGVICLSNVPHGFYEREMQGFFSQFGEIVRLRLSRNLRTFKPRGYAFIQFKVHEVAEIVQQTMNNYILCEKVLRCELLQPEKVHDDMFHPKLMRKRVIDFRKVELRKQKLPKTKEQKEKRVHSLLRKEKKKRSKLRDLGIQYEFSGFKGVASKGK